MKKSAPIIMILISLLIGCSVNAPINPDYEKSGSPVIILGDCSWTAPEKTGGGGTGEMLYNVLEMGAPCDICEWVPLTFTLEITAVTPYIIYEIRNDGNDVTRGYVGVCDIGTKVLFFYPYFPSFPQLYEVGDTWVFYLTY